MTAFVVDASVVCAWLFEDEATPATDALLARLSDDDAIAPALLPFEVGNVAAMAQTRGRVSEIDLSVALTTLAGLAVTLAPENPAYIYEDVRLLARRRGLTVYGAAYLDLAMRRRLPLASLDKALRKAAEAEGVALLP